MSRIELELAKILAENVLSVRKPKNSLEELFLDSVQVTTGRIFVVVSQSLSQQYGGGSQFPRVD